MQIAKAIALSAVVLAGFGTSSAQAATAVRAHTPSGNINCVARNYGGPGWTLTCSAADPGRTMGISMAGKAYKSRYRHVRRGHGFTMYYDSSYHLGPYNCKSFTAGLRCSFASNWYHHHNPRVGFWISRESGYTF